jgi:putative transposase
MTYTEIYRTSKGLSKVVRQAFPALAKKTGREQLWTSAYYVGTASHMSAETIRRYITECQGK